MTLLIKQMSEVIKIFLKIHFMIGSIVKADAMVSFGTSPSAVTIHIVNHNDINSLAFSDVKWYHETWSTLVRIMACCNVDLSSLGSYGFHKKAIT